MVVTKNFEAFRNSGDYTWQAHRSRVSESDELSPEFNRSDELSQNSAEMTNFHAFTSNSRIFSFLSEVTKRRGWVRLRACRGESICKCGFRETPPKLGNTAVFYNYRLNENADLLAR
jgi:hypothetical protein